MMKTLKKIKLTEFSQAEFELKKREMKDLKGAQRVSVSGACTCVCIGSGRPSADYPIGSSSNEAS